MRNTGKAKMTKTQVKICNALKALLEERDYDDISVTDLVLKADISRSSFYNHFEKKEDVIDLMIKVICENISAYDRLEDQYDKESSASNRWAIIDYCRTCYPDIKLIFESGFGGNFYRLIRKELYKARTSFNYEFEDEDGNKQILSDGIIYDIKTFADVNHTISMLELYFDKYSDMTSEEFDKKVEEAAFIKMTGNFYKK